jgi:hypothetical protein
MDQSRRKGGAGKIRGIDFSRIHRSEAGFTYIEMILSLMLMTLFVPILFAFFYTICIQAKELMQEQKLEMQWSAFAITAHQELAAAEELSIENGVCHWRNRGGAWVRYKVLHQRLLRQVAHEPGRWQGSMTMLLGVNKAKVDCFGGRVSIYARMGKRDFQLTVRPRKRYNE